MILKIILVVSDGLKFLDHFTAPVLFILFLYFEILWNIFKTFKMRNDIRIT